ncbi:MAG TPA: DUF2310 family Zn-ribbon-containing protein, partial [Pirellulales bacterium]
RFGSDGDKGSNRDELADVADWYVAAICHNGQISHKYVGGWVRGVYMVVVKVARPNALDERFHSAWGRRDRGRVVELFRGPPVLEVLDDDVPKRSPSWKRASSLFLFTHAFDDTSAVCSGDTGRPIPAYLVPLSDEQREHLWFWTQRYRKYDDVWFDSHALETPAYRQLVDPHSELSQEGREHCREIEKATGKPTYYYLHRYYGRRSGEESRVCPSCGQPWRDQTKSLRKTASFHRFPFRCHPCRLVGQVTNNCDDARRARLGEFKPSAKRD